MTRRQGAGISLERCGMDDIDRRLLGVSTFLQLEHAARQAETVAALRFTMVNETRRLLPYRQAAMARGAAGGAMTVEAVSGVALLDRNAPFLRWLQRVMTRLAAAPDAAKPHVIDPALLGKAERRDWAEWSAPQVLWCPLAARDGTLAGALWLAREEPWQDNDIVLLERLAHCYAHAWLALSGGRRAGRGRRRPALALAAALLAVGGGLALPVRQSALAPAEIVAVEPLAVSAPLDGVIARFHIEPNQPVAAGQPLFSFDDTNLRSQAEVAERTLGIAQAELRQATQGALYDRRSAAQLALLEAQMQVRAAELDYARALLGRVTVTAERAGVAVFTDVNDWIGRPVVTGQRILQLADPARTELRVHLAVRDVIALAQGAEVRLFLDTDPLAPLPAAVTTLSYEAEMTPGGVLAYRIAAAFPQDLAPPRIGLQGTAKLYGERVPLFLYLFRRPFAAARQLLGV